METTAQIQVFTALQFADLWFLAEAAGRTLMLSAIAIVCGTALGCALGWVLSAGQWAVKMTLGIFLDVFRSVPLIIQLVLFHNFVPLVGFPMSPFKSGAIVLLLYAAALVAFVARGGFDTAPIVTRRAARSLGMTYLQTLLHVVFPLGLRAVFPSWVGIALGVLKDSALVSALGYMELLRASQALTTRTQEPLLVLALAGAFYFALSYPISKFGERVELRWRDV